MYNVDESLITGAESDVWKELFSAEEARKLISDTKREKDLELWNSIVIGI